MDFKHAIMALGEKGILFEINSKNMTLSFYSYLANQKIKLWVIHDGDTAIQDFKMEDHDDIIEIIEENAGRTMLAPLHSLKHHAFYPMCDDCLKSDDELETDMWNREFEKDYTDRYHDFMASPTHAFSGL